MRKRFEQQLEFGIIPISEVQINHKTRHELPPLLVGLQYAFKNKELSESLFKVLEEKILYNKKKTGRKGMSLWEVMVLGLVRQTLNVDYDFLHDQANNHRELRGILGVGRSDMEKGKQYHYQTLKDNVSLLDESTLNKLNELIVKGAHDLIKKKEGVAVMSLSIKADSFVVLSDIHFPTDLNLLWDASRKCLDLISLLRQGDMNLRGWGQQNKWYNKVRNSYREVSEIHRKKGKNYQERLSASTRKYLKVCSLLSKKVKETFEDACIYLASQGTKIEGEQLKVLRYYWQMLDKHIDLVKRRILLGEKIPHEEKVFSLFEPHVEWHNKGKANGKIELGHNVLAATDQYHFILYHEVYEQQVDKQRSIVIGRSIAENYTGPAYHLSSISFDRNFYSGPAKQALEKLYDQVIMPKPGKKTKAQQEQETQAAYQEKRKAHSAVEANINQLEHHGLDKCPDKGMTGFKRYVAYSVLAYNIHRLGQYIMDQRRAQCPKAIHHYQSVWAVSG